MQRRKSAFRRLALMALGAAAATLVAPERAAATTLIRASLQDLAARNAAVVVGRVQEERSYWNKDGTFILTDVLIHADEVVKGDLATGDLTVTLMGGTVGETTVLVVGAARLVPGKSYVLFLNEEDLPGAEGVRTVRDHCQGVFEIADTKTGPRAVSQANEQGLLPDAQGRSEAPGGTDGLPVDTLTRAVREAATGRR